eukprot:16036255-Heterocapsa_arctica.AAC.1
MIQSCSKAVQGGHGTPRGTTGHNGGQRGTTAGGHGGQRAFRRDRIKPLRSRQDPISSLSLGK